MYKIVPRLHQNEIARQWSFLKQNQPHQGLRPLLPGDLSDETVRDRIVDKIHLYSPEDKISLSVEYERLGSNRVLYYASILVVTDLNPTCQEHLFHMCVFSSQWSAVRSCQWRMPI